MNINDLLEAAKQATPSSEWGHIDRCRDYCGNELCSVTWVSPGFFRMGAGFAPDDATYIAKCYPESIIALCEFVKDFDRWESLSLEDGWHEEKAVAWNRLLEARRRLHRS